MSKKLLFLSILPILLIFGFVSFVAADDPVPLWGHAWSSNIGWISFRGANYDVNILPDGALSGYAWSSNIGWIDFGPNGGFPASPAHGAKLEGGQISGWARAIAPNVNGESGWDGWIKLNSVTVVDGDHLSSNNFAWGDEVVGWVRFCSPGYPSGFCVKVGNLPPPGASNPVLSFLDSTDHIEILSQPLTSPAISSGIGIKAEGGGGGTPLNVKVLDVVSLVSGKSLLKTAADGGILSSAGNQLLPTCYLDNEEYVPGGSFSACDSLSLPMAGVGAGAGVYDEAHFHIRIHRPVQVLNDHNPYQVILGDLNPVDADDQVSFLFDYRVGTVNPI